jgi:hypothetical protein
LRAAYADPSPRADRPRPARRAGRRSQSTTASTISISCATARSPKLFVSGSRDQFGPAGKLEALVDTFSDPKKLVRIEAGDHFFEGRLREMRGAIEDWVREIVREQRRDRTTNRERFSIIPPCPTFLSEREQQFAHMRETAREIFHLGAQERLHRSAFARNVHCERRILRIGEDLHDLDSYNRVFVVSIGKAAHTMAAALEAQVGGSLEGIVASSVEPALQVRGFRYFRGGIPLPPPNPSAPPRPSSNR